MLLLIPLIFLFIWYFARHMRNMYYLRRRLILILRNLIMVLLVLALAGLNIKWTVDTVTTIFLIDASDSMKENREYAESFVRNTINIKDIKDKIGVIAFANDSKIESFIAKDTVFNKIETQPKGIYTNIENALATSIALMPHDTKKRIVLITDGKENIGTSSNMAATIINQGVDLKVLKISKDVQNEVAIQDISIPDKLRIGEEFNIIINVESKGATGAKLTLFSGRDKAVEQKVQLQKGNNRFVFRDKALSGGLKSYAVSIQPDLDTETRNNEATAITNVLDRPKILVLEDKEGESEELLKILEASDIDYKKINARLAPSTLQELISYKTVISCNVSAEKFNEGFLNSIEAYVKDFGGGFIVTGGEDSFALGGYYKTSIEKVLPVSMELKGKKEIPDMSMVLIIDKSGSMTEARGGITRLDIAKEAASRVLDSLRTKDKIGVLTFDDTSYWVVETQSVDNPHNIRDDIGTIRPGGGTSILPALEVAYESIKKSGTKIKHMILLTDGQAEKTGYQELVDKIKDDNITISTVAVGEGADTSLLERIATNGNGRFYYTDEVVNIPRIFAKETFMAAKAYLNNREFTPVINDYNNVLMDLLQEGMPSLLGYVAVSAKDTARVILSSDQNDPILTMWQYGLGKTVAWNSDISGRWSANYTNWNNNIFFWQRIINWTIEKYNQDELEVETEIKGSKGIVTVKSNTVEDGIDIKANIAMPSLESINITLSPTSPGEYVGNFDLEETGAYLIKLQQLKDGNTISSFSTGISVKYSPEYKLDSETGTIDRLVKEAGGILIGTPEEVYEGDLENIFGRIDLTNFLLITALLLFVIDIALRRLNLPLERLEGILRRSGRKEKATKKEVVMVTKKTSYINSIPKDVEESDNENKKDSIVNKERTVNSKNRSKRKVDKNEKTLDTSSLLKQKKDRD